jgi:hypothetical protein
VTWVNPYEAPENKRALERENESQERPHLSEEQDRRRAGSSLRRGEARRLFP